MNVVQISQKNLYINSKLFSDRTLTHKFLSTYLNRHTQQRRIQCKPVEEAFWSKSSRVESNRVESLQLAVLVKSARPGVTLPAWRHFKSASAAADSFASWFDWDKGFHIHRYIKICMFVCVYVCSGLAHLFYLMGVAWTNLLPAVANLFQCQVNHSNYSNIDVPPSMSQLSSIYLFYLFLPSSTSDTLERKAMRNSRRTQSAWLRS